MVGASGLSEVFHILILVVVTQGSAYVKTVLGLHLDVFIILGILCNSTTVIEITCMESYRSPVARSLWTQIF